MWNDYYLKFADEAEFNGTMPPELMEGESETHATDIIGTLYRQDTFEALPSFHVNLKLKLGTPLPACLEAHSLPKPEWPKRVFA